MLCTFLLTFVLFRLVRLFLVYTYYMNNDKRAGDTTTSRAAQLAALLLMLVLCTGWAAGNQTAGRPVLASIHEEN